VSELERLLEQPIYQVGINIGDGRIVHLNLGACDDEAERQQFIRDCTKTKTKTHKVVDHAMSVDRR